MSVCGCQIAIVIDDCLIANWTMMLCAPPGHDTSIERETFKVIWHTHTHTKTHTHKSKEKPTAACTT